jgi:hypothetical protein
MSTGPGDNSKRARKDWGLDATIVLINFAAHEP